MTPEQVTLGVLVRVRDAQDHSPGAIISPRILDLNVWRRGGYETIPCVLVSLPARTQWTPLEYLDLYP